MTYKYTQMNARDIFDTTDNGPVDAFCNIIREIRVLLKPCVIAILVDNGFPI